MTLPDADHHQHLSRSVLFALRDGSMPESEAGRWRIHLQTCARCRDLERALSPVIEGSLAYAEILASGLETSLAPEIREKLAAEQGLPVAWPAAPRDSSRITASRRHRSSVRRAPRKRWSFNLALAGAVLSAVGVSLILTDQKPPAGPPLTRPAANDRAQADRTPTRRAPTRRAAVYRPKGVAPAPNVPLPATPTPREAFPQIPVVPTPSGASVPVPALPPIPAVPEPRGQRGSRTADAAQPAIPPETGSSRPAYPEPVGESARPIGRLVKSQGAVRYARGTQRQWVDAVPGTPLLAGDRLRTSRGMALLEIGHSTVYMHQISTLRILAAQTDAGEAALVELSKGEIFVENDGLNIHVETPDGLLSPAGTRFDVYRRVSTTVVTVQEGEVEVRAKAKATTPGPSFSPKSRTVNLRGRLLVGRAVRVKAGYQTRVRQGLPAPQPVKVAVGKAFAWTGLLQTRRVVLRLDFSRRPHGWSGTWAGGVLAGRPEAQTPGRLFVRSPWAKRGLFKASGRTRIRFRCKLTGTPSLTVMLYDQTARNNYIAVLRPRSDAWQTHDVRIADLRRQGAGPGLERARPGDVFCQIHFIAPIRRPEETALLVDFVEVYEPGGSGR